MNESAQRSGVLPGQAIRQMLDSGEIYAAEASAALEVDQIQPASLDLRLGLYAYPVDTSFLPGRGIGVLEKLRQLDPAIDRFKIDLRNGAVLEKGRVYVVPLLEAIRLRSNVCAVANPKSSTGRLDILTRLISEGADTFDEVGDGYAGRLFIEIAPRTFSIVVKTGTRLNQLRFRRTRGVLPRPITAGEWRTLLSEGQILGGENPALDSASHEQPGRLPFTIDLKGDGTERALIGWRAKKHTYRLDLERRDYDPRDFFEPIRLHRHASLVLVPDEFYILATRECIAVPPGYAAEMLPYETRAGEFRVHYAGFFDPGFGYGEGRALNSRGVLEVRSHEVPFLLEHGQIVGWLTYERMADIPHTLYGQALGSNYQGQTLKLAKQFRPLDVPVAA